MARAALQQSLDGEDAPPALPEVVYWHGRQLTDRALLASIPWFLWPSPRRALARFRRDLLTRGDSDVCFDIDVPKPWRRDIVQALVRQGHTVVPYALHQPDATRAEVHVYDPNYPDEPEAERSVITFDLVRNRYGYRSLVDLNDHSTTVVAVRQSAYAQGRTAILASVASLLLYPSVTLDVVRVNRAGANRLGISVVAALAAGRFVRGRRTGR
jgi:hypothetical protein